MYRLRLLCLLLVFTLQIFVTAQNATNPDLSTSTTPALNITAISASNGSSILQCWQLDNFQVSSVPGTVGALSVFLGDASNVSYTIIPARTNAGLHRAPAAQFVAFFSGLIHLTLPNSTDDAWVVGGKYGLIFADDTADVSTYGHGTTYVSDEDTVTLQIPLMAGQILNHTVLHEGGCKWQDLAGL